MKEKLIIKKFGPIEDVELELGRFTVLIGEQATGKSTVAKLLAVCRYFSAIAPDLSGEEFNQNFRSNLSSRGLGEFLNSESFVHYSNIDYDFKFQSYPQRRVGSAFGIKEWIEVKTEIQPNSSRFKRLLEEYRNIETQGFPYEFPVSFSAPVSFFQNNVAAVMDNPFFFYTERGLQSIFSLGKDTIPNINDVLFNFFADLDRIAKQFAIETDIEPLDITYQNVNGSALIRKKSEAAFFSLKNGASGYQSAIPIILVTKYYNNIRKKSKTFIVEEPELNLFPAAQNSIVKYLVNQCIEHNNTILVTTHSPYILTSLNNLLYSHKVGKEHKEQAEKITDDKYWLNPEDVCAYMMLPNGKCEDITDKEGLIKAEKIDEVSEVLNYDFNALMDIELNEKK